MTALQAMKAVNDEGLSFVIRWNNINRELTVKRRWNLRDSASDYHTSDILDALETARERNRRMVAWSYKTGGGL